MVRDIRELLSVPRPTGSNSLRDFVDWLGGVLPGGFVQSFPTRRGRGLNYIFRYGKVPKWIFGTHIDTHPSSPGFNDGFSGVLFLLKLVPILMEREIPFIVGFFDNEEVVSERPIRGDAVFTEMGSFHFITSRYFRAPTDGVIIFDMLLTPGHPPYPLDYESWDILFSRGEEDFIKKFCRHNVVTTASGVRILDDHIPFLLSGHPTILLIGWGDPYWHTENDRPENYTDENITRLLDLLVPLL